MAKGKYDSKYIKYGYVTKAMEIIKLSSNKANQLVELSCDRTLKMKFMEAWLHLVYSPPSATLTVTF